MWCGPPLQQIYPGTPGPGLGWARYRGRSEGHVGVHYKAHGRGLGGGLPGVGGQGPAQSRGPRVEPRKTGKSPAANYESSACNNFYIDI